MASILTAPLTQDPQIISALPVAANPLGKKEYAELYQLVKERGLLDKQPAFYFYKIVFSIGLMAVSLVIMAMVDILWVQVLNAVLMSLAFAQVAFLGHDSGHQQMFSTLRKNDTMLLVVNFLTGLNRSWWIDKHHRHHAHPNDTSSDLDIDLPFLAFTDEQALTKSGLLRFVVRYQAFFLFPLMLFEGFSLRADSTGYLVRRKNRAGGGTVKYLAFEVFALATHMTLYLGILLYLLDPWTAFTFLVVHHVVWGVYMATVFAPNHKGMPIIADGTRLDFIRQQVLTARSIKGSWFGLVEFYYGGLNYQIEHHLFPTMSRNKLKKVRPIVMEFCAAHAIPYHETGVIQSWKEIVKFLHSASAALRVRAA
jgi:fatty acid desaturase